MCTHLQQRILNLTFKVIKTVFKSRQLAQLTIFTFSNDKKQNPSYKKTTYFSQLFPFII